jgi:hypothetical protein
VRSLIVQHTRILVSEVLTPPPNHFHRHDFRTLHLH